MEPCNLSNFDLYDLIGYALFALIVLFLRRVELNRIRRGKQPFF